MIKEYLSYNEWQDKVGVLIEKYIGDINTVIGFPLEDVESILKEEFNYE